MKRTPSIFIQSFLWVLLAIYAIARILQIVPAPQLLVVALHVWAPLLFALFHGAQLYRWRGIFIFCAICLLVTNILENIGVRTGFPFGHYYFATLMGPKLLVVPISLGLAYIGMGYLSWTLGRIILGDLRGPLSGNKIVTVPLIAAFIMVAWDFSQDPVWATILHGWVWLNGGAYFGVPVSNFLGWYLVVYVVFQLFALYLKRQTLAQDLSANYWRLPILFYAVSAAGNILLVIPKTAVATATDPTGMQWRISDITGTSALVSIFVMGAFTVIAWARFMDEKQKPATVSSILVSEREETTAIM